MLWKIQQTQMFQSSNGQSFPLTQSLSGCDLLKDTGMLFVFAFLKVSICLLLTSSCHQFLQEVPKHLKVGTFKTRAQGNDLFAILETKKSCQNRPRASIFSLFPNDGPVEFQRFLVVLGVYRGLKECRCCSQVVNQISILGTKSSR